MKATMARENDSIRIDGATVAVVLYPVSDGRVGVQAVAYPAATGYDRACRLGAAEGLPYMSRGDITLAGDRLVCMASAATGTLADRYREGFAFDLDPGMAEFVTAAIPRIFRVAEIAAELVHQTRQVRRREPHLNEVQSITAAVAAAVLDGHDFAAWLRVELELMHNPTDPDDRKGEARLSHPGQRASERATGAASPILPFSTAEHAAKGCATNAMGDLCTPYPYIADRVHSPQSGCT
ncbi:hypothetical protein [Xanthomonas theicola]|uniref:Uncharacterized protein n=1 Tax=Xanthomonas theicola TaxID=56464 RepID=A0A2S6ZGL8_9XANT|nr:hypothetical protein [Xanthomonas theicola]PPT91404.1 hypothetical protein XthCFBP4691_07705 [Xanthomonas theicola]QNH27209.1 hypothetical protein G4Q83_22335 [Xanthomonas theicola]